MTLLEMIYGPLVQGVQNVSEYVGNLANSVVNLFNGVDFSILYNWLPQDVQNVIGGFIALLIVFALISFIKKFLMFTG